MAATALLDDLERLQRRRVVPAGLLHHARAGLVEDQPPAPGRGLEGALPDRGGASPRRRLARPELRSGKAETPVIEDRRRHRLVHETDLSGAARIERLAREDQVERRRQTHDPRQPRAAAPGGEDSQPHLGQSDLSLARIRHRPEIAGESQFRPASEARAVDGSHGGIRKVGELLEEGLHARNRGVHFFELDAEELLDVRPGDEHVGFSAANQQAADARLPRQAHQHVGQLAHDGGRELVDLFSRQIEGQDREAVVLDPQVEGAHESSTTMAPPWPPPMHIVARPNWVPRRRISFSRVVTSRLAEDPTGCPSAIAPPLTFVRSQSISPMGPSVWYFACQARRRKDPGARQDLGRKGFVDLHQADVLPGEARVLQRDRSRDRRAQSHALRLEGAEGKPADLSQRLVPARPGRRGAHDERRGRAVGDLRRVARGHRPELPVEVRLQLRQGLHALVLAHSIVLGRHCLVPRGDRHRNDLLGELGARERDPLVRAQGQSVLFQAGDSVLLRQDLGGLPHVEAADGVGQAHLEADLGLEVFRPELRGRRDSSAQVPGGEDLGEDLLAFVRIEQRDVRHGLDTRRQDRLRISGGDAIPGVHDRLQTRTAQAVDCVGRHLVRDARLERRDPSDVDRVRRLRDVAEDHLIQTGGIEVGPRQKLGDDDPTQLGGGDVFQFGAGPRVGSAEAIDDDDLTRHATFRRSHTCVRSASGTGSRGSAASLSASA